MYEYTHIYMIIHVEEERNHFEKYLEQLFNLEVHLHMYKRRFVL